MTNEELLGELEDLVRTMPPRATLRHPEPENFAWLGRATAVIENWNPLRSVAFGLALDQFNRLNAHEAQEGYRKIQTILQQARHDLRMKTVGPVTSAFGHGQVFDYFDDVRKTIETATQDILFVDPYLDADFVSKYLPHVKKGAVIRLLAREKIATLLPAVEQFAAQFGSPMSLRSASGFHDRYMLIDGGACFQSGASFKDGAKHAPTTLTQITDAFEAVKQTYEDIWAGAKILM